MTGRVEQGLFCLRSASAFLLLQQGERALTGVLLEPTTLRCRGVVRCVEAVPCRGLQGLRSPSLFLEVVGGVMGRWLRMAREALSTQDREGKISLLLRNGSKKTERCGGDLVKVLWGVEEEVELAMTAIVREKAGDCNGLDKEQAVALVLGKQDALEALVAASVKRLPLLSPSNPHHDQIRTVFRSLLLTLAYHTNSLSLFPIPSPANSVPSPANSVPSPANSVPSPANSVPSPANPTTFPANPITTDLIKKAARLFTLLNSCRQQHGRTWESEVLFASSLVSSVYEARPALLSPEACYSVDSHGGDEP